MARRAQAQAAAAVEGAAAVVDDAANAAAEGDSEEFERLLEEAEGRLRKAEEEIAWLKTELKKTGELTTPIASTLANLSSKLEDQETRLKELSQKFATLTPPPNSAPAEPSTETPVVAAATDLAPPASAPPQMVENPVNANAGAPVEVQKRRIKMV